MHRDSIEPGIASDISTVSPKGGSIGSNPIERIAGNNYGELRRLQSIISDLLRRVKDLESGNKPVPISEDNTEALRRLFDERYLIKNGPAQTVSGQVTFAGAAFFNDFNLQYGWRFVCSENALYTFHYSVNAGQTA